ncbi:unnamed protein product [Thelazia callipaeda]|uniref:DB domain-containing protein n=1 Tax=Thelazia callipaeda TaxID=103827 RepID=A0A0N5CK66_THECL|nr:unnamed protein product [Thelazia callipaeda]
MSILLQFVFGLACLAALNTALVTCYNVRPEIVKAAEASLQFMECCEKAIGSHFCTQSLCNFDKIKPYQVLMDSFICKKKVRPIWDCASQKKDHTSCCSNRNVEPSCLSLCNGTKKVDWRTTKPISCLQYFKEIVECFVEDRFT